MAMGKRFGVRAFAWGLVGAGAAILEVVGAGCGAVTVATVLPIVDQMGSDGGSASANSPPTADAVTVTSAPLETGGPHGDVIEVRFRLADAEGEPASVEVFGEVPADVLQDPERLAHILAPLDADGRFRATLTADSPSLADLATSPQGVEYTFRWRSAADLVNLADVRLRVVPSGGGGQSAGDLSELIDIVNDLPRLVAPDLAPAEVGVAYASGPVVEGGIPPYTLTVPESQRPRGLAVVGAELVGVPEQAGFFSIDYAITDSVGARVAPPASEQLTVAEPLRLASDFIPLGTPGQTDFSYRLPVRGGQGSAAFTLETIVEATLDYAGGNGIAPVVGESLEIETAVASPVRLGRAKVVSVTGDGTAGTLELGGLGITIAAGQRIRGVDSGFVATVALFARDPRVPPRFVTGLPDGLALDPDGRIQGSCPDEATLRADHGGIDDFLVRVKATDALGAESTRNYVLRVRRTFAAAQNLPLPVVRYTALALGDWDGDGDGDIALSPEPGPEVHHLRLVENQGAGGLVPIAPQLAGGAPETRAIFRLVSAGKVDAVAGDDALIVYLDRGVELIGGPELSLRARTGLVSIGGSLAFGTLPSIPAALELATLDLIPAGAGGAEGVPELLMLTNAAAGIAVRRIDLVKKSLNLQTEMPLPTGVLPETLAGAAPILHGGLPALALGFPGRVLVAVPSVDAGGAIVGWSVEDHPFQVAVDQVDVGGSPVQVLADFVPGGLAAVDAGERPPLVLAGAVEGLQSPPRVEGAVLVAFDPSLGRYVVAGFGHSTGASEPRRNGARPAVADLDDDGSLDLVIPLPGERTVALVFGPLGSLPPRVDLTRALRVPVPAECDLALPGIHDGDGSPKLDLLVASSRELAAALRQTVTLVRNIGQPGGILPQRVNAPGVFLTGGATQVGEGAVRPFVAIDDFDGDGLNDVLVQRNEVRAGAGSTSNTSKRGELLGGIGQTFVATAVLFRHDDADDEQSAAGDESLSAASQDDIATAPAAGADLDQALRSGSAFGGLAQLGFASGDVDGDGRAEFCLSTLDATGAPIVAVRGADENGALEGLAELRAEPDPRVFTHLAIADLADQDGVVPGAPNRGDILGISVGAGGELALDAFVQRAPAGDQLQFEAVASTPLGADLAILGDLIVGDFTGDGIADACVTLNDPALGPELGLVPGFGEPPAGATGLAAVAFGPLVRFALPTAGALAEIASADAVDADQDGDLDVVLLVVDTVEDELGTLVRVATVHTIENDGLGILVDRGRKLVLPAIHDRALSARDLNGDGDFDLAVLGSGEAARLTVLIGGGDGSFVTSDAVIVGRQAAAMRTADIDRDGVPDVVIFAEAFDELISFSSDGYGRLVRWTR